MTEAGGSHLLILGAPSRQMFQPAEKRGLDVVLLTAPHMLKDADLPPCVVRAEALDWTSKNSAVDQILKLHGQFPLAGIVTMLEAFLVPVAQAATELGLPTNPPAAVRNTRDKVRMRQILETAGVGQVRFAACDSLADAERFLAEVGGPIFVKPADGAASHGVSRVDRPSQLATAFELVSTSFASGRPLCEEFLIGPESSLEAISVDGRFVPVAFTDKLIDDNFAEIGHQQPSEQPEEVLRAAAELVAEALSHLGVGFGLTHTEFKITACGPVIVETHTRVASDNIHLLTERTTGIDFLDVMVGMAVGERPDIRPRPTGVAAAVRWLRGGPGRVKSIRLPAVDAERGLVAAGAEMRPGDRVSLRSYSVSGPQLAYVLTTGPSVSVAAARADSFLPEVAIELEADDADASPENLDERGA